MTTTTEYAVCPCCRERLPMDGEDVPMGHAGCGEFTEWQLATMRAGVEERREEAQ
jgi:hypothetical protein